METSLTSTSLAVAISDMGIPTSVQFLALVIAIILANRLLSS